MTAVVISQSFYFPWIGMLEQVRLADVYVFYDDVQFSRGSFVNRVQLKTGQGVQWLTVPCQSHRLGESIEDVKIDHRQDWLRVQRERLCQAFAQAAFRDDAISVFDEAFAGAKPSTLAQASRQSLMSLIRYFGLEQGRRFIDVKALGISGRSSQRVVDVCTALNASRYITGHGAARYLDHSLFEERNIRVEYMSYRKCPYPQSFGPFTPFVTSLDAIAHCGPAAIDLVCSQTIDWRSFTLQRDNDSQTVALEPALSN